MTKMINILVCCNKKDYFLTKICVGSIRYYYPEARICILKDEANGAFDTSELEQSWNVQTIGYPEKDFGWSGSKMFFYTDPRFKGERWLVIDSDIVLIGKLLDESWAADFEDDIIVSPEETTDARNDWFTRTYFNIGKIEQQYPDYVFQRYTFNCGQMFCRPGFIERSDIGEFFDFERFPRWKRLDIMPLVDQSLFNFLLPRMEQQGRLKLGKHPYMYWSESPLVAGLPLEKIREGTHYPALIHWAGALRIEDISKMTRPDILNFFEDFYYSKVTGGKSKQRLRRTKAVLLISLKKKIKAILALPRKAQRPA